MYENTCKADEIKFLKKWNSFTSIFQNVLTIFIKSCTTQQFSDLTYLQIYLQITIH